MSSLSRIRMLADTVAQAERELAVAVATARDPGLFSWAAIGAALRVSRQAAQQRYGGK